MLTAVAIVHVIVCLLLIALVLLQDPKSGGTGSMFGGGGSNSLFGATGAVTFLTRLTRYSAVIFGVTCIVLTLLSRPETRSVLDSLPAAAATPTGSSASPTPAPGASATPASAAAAQTAPAASASATPATAAPAPAADKAATPAPKASKK